MPSSHLTQRKIGTLSAIVIGVILIIGTFIGARLAEQQTAVSVEMLQAQDKYYVAEAFATLDNSGLGDGRGTVPLKRMDKYCVPAPVTDSRNQAGSSEDIIVRYAFHCQSSLKNDLSWRFFFLYNTSGYSGGISMIVGLDNRQVLQYLKVLQHRETAGYGARILESDSKWLSSLLNRPQSFFNQRLLLANRETEQTIDAVSGATITARAILTALAQSFPDK